ncbi:hypothetical protein Tsubulata_049610, partial [Turnera subulata]
IAIPFLPHEIYNNKKPKNCEPINDDRSTKEVQKICGATTAWVIMVDVESTSITLVNTFGSREVQIKLPQISSSLGEGGGQQNTTEYVVHKAVMCWLLDEEDSSIKHVVMVIYGEAKQLAYCKEGDETWTSLEEYGSGFDDIICHEEEFYAVDGYGKVLRLQLINSTSNASSPASMVQLEPEWSVWEQKVYFVSVGAKLCLVVRDFETEPGQDWKTSFIRICMLDFEQEKGLGVGDIGNWTILLGRHCTVAVPGTCWPGMRSNCAYFKDEPSYDEIYKVGHIRAFSFAESRVQEIEYSSHIWKNIWEELLLPVD